MENLELGIFHPMQQHIHACEVISRDIFLLPVDFADAASAVAVHLMTDIEKQRPGTAGEIEDFIDSLFRAGRRILAVQCNDLREDGRNLLRSIEFAGFLSRTGSELTDQILVSIPQSIGVIGKLRDTLCDLFNDLA